MTKTYLFDATGDPEAPDNVLVKSEISFGAACQLLKTLADQNWRAAVLDLNEEIENEHTPEPVRFQVVGKFKTPEIPPPEVHERDEALLEMINRWEKTIWWYQEKAREARDAADLDEERRLVESGAAIARCIIELSAYIHGKPNPYAKGHK